MNDAGERGALVLVDEADGVGGGRRDSPRPDRAVAALEVERGQERLTNGRARRGASGQSARSPSAAVDRRQPESGSTRSGVGRDDLRGPPWLVEGQINEGSGFHRRPRRAPPARQEPIGHRVLLRWFRLRMDPFETRADNSPVMAPAGAVHMTILDLARYGTAHLDGESSPSPTLLPHAAWERLHTPVRDDYARGWVRVERDWAGGSLLWHNGSNTLWYALLMLLPARNTVLAFATNEGAIQAAETAFVELARELGGSAPGS